MVRKSIKLSHMYFFCLEKILCLRKLQALERAESQIHAKVSPQSFVMFAVVLIGKSIIFTWLERA